MNTSSIDATPEEMTELPAIVTNLLWLVVSMAFISVPALMLC